jgi:hypothetical protein
LGFFLLTGCRETEVSGLSLELMGKEGLVPPTSLM